MFDSKEIDRKIDELLLKEPTPENLNLIGDLFLKKGDKKRAVDYFMRAAKNTTMLRKAIALYKKILRISPLDTEAYEALIDLLERSYNIPEAIKYLDLLSHLYQNKGETIKFTETQRRIRVLKHDWEKLFSSKEIRTKESEPVTFEVMDTHKEAGETDVTPDKIIESTPPRRKTIWIIAMSILILIILFSSLLLFRDRMERPKEHHRQIRVHNYDVSASSLTEESIKTLPQIDITPEDLKSATLYRITIKALEGCIPHEIIDKPFESIACLNYKGIESRPLYSHVTEGSKRIVYKYGVCSNSIDIVFAELYTICPMSHSSGVKIKGLVTEPVLILWERR